MQVEEMERKRGEPSQQFLAKYKKTPISESDDEKKKFLSNFKLATAYRRHTLDEYEKHETLENENEYKAADEIFEHMIEYGLNNKYITGEDANNERFKGSWSEFDAMMGNLYIPSPPSSKQSPGGSPKMSKQEFLSTLELARNKYLDKLKKNDENDNDETATEFISVDAELERLGNYGVQKGYITDYQRLGLGYKDVPFLKDFNYKPHKPPSSKQPQGSSPDIPKKKFLSDLIRARNDYLDKLKKNTENKNEQNEKELNVAYTMLKVLADKGYEQKYITYDQLLNLRYENVPFLPGFQLLPVSPNKANSEFNKRITNPNKTKDKLPVLPYNEEGSQGSQGSQGSLPFVQDIPITHEHQNSPLIPIGGGSPPHPDGSDGSPSSSKSKSPQVPGQPIKYIQTERLPVDRKYKNPKFMSDTEKGRVDYERKAIRVAPPNAKKNPKDDKSLCRKKDGRAFQIRPCGRPKGVKNPKEPARQERDIDDWERNYVKKFVEKRMTQKQRLFHRAVAYLYRQRNSKVTLAELARNICVEPLDGGDWKYDIKTMHQYRRKSTINLPMYITRVRYRGLQTTRARTNEKYYRQPILFNAPEEGVWSLNPRFAAVVADLGLSALFIEKCNQLIDNLDRCGPEGFNYD